MIVAISLTEEEQEYLLRSRPEFTLHDLSIAGKIRKSRAEEWAWEEILSDEEKLIISLKSRRKCPACKREFKVRVNGKLRLHRDAYGKACAGEYPKASAGDSRVT